ncbi:MAG: diguanylate cyclase [Thiohalophilus sp.]|jgi:diguanylate cyclase (GGDEF)-like protein
MPKKLDITQLQQLLGNAPVGMLMLDKNGRVSWLNSTLTDALGKDRCAQLLDKQQDEIAAPLSGLFNTNERLHLPADAEHPDVWLTAHQQSLPDNQGTIYYFADITTLQQENDGLRQELKDIIMVDKETGMRNRKGLYYSLEPQLSRSRRYNRPLSIIIMRLECLDEFKQHIGRDDALPLLKAISYLLSDQLRWADIVGRLDETDFLLVLPEIKIDDANKVTDNLREQVAAIKIADMPGSDFSITARFGVAEWRKGDDMGLLLMRARSMLEDSNPQPAATG